MTSDIKKFLLVDSSNINDLRSAIDNGQKSRTLPQATRELNRLDQQMLDTVNDQSLSEEDRVAKYNKALAEFQQLRTVASAPSKLQDKSKDQSSATSSNDHNPLVGIIPVIYQKKAEQLLKLISRAGGIKLDEKGSIISDRLYERAANITDLLNKAVNPKFSSKKLVKSWDTFQQMLADLQVPRSLLSTKYRDTTDDTSTLVDTSFHTPVTGYSTVESKPRKRSIKAWSKWSPSGNST